MLSAVLSKFGIKLRADSAEALMREAIYNPDVASTWAKAAKGQPFTMNETNKFINHLASAGIRIAVNSAPLAPDGMVSLKSVSLLRAQSSR